MDDKIIDSFEGEEESIPFADLKIALDNRSLHLSEISEEIEDSDEETEEEWGEGKENSKSVDDSIIDEDIDPQEILEQDTILAMQKIFNEFKDPKTKKFPTQMLGVALQMIGQTPTLAKIRKYEQFFDENERGWVTLVHLLKAAANQHKAARPITIEQAEAAFKYLLQKYSKTNKLMIQLLSICEPLSPTEAAIMKAVADPSNSGSFDLKKLLVTIDPSRKPIIKKTKKKQKKKGPGGKGLKGKKK